MLGGNERRPKDDDALGKAFRAGHEVTEEKETLLYVSGVVIRP